MIRLFQQAQALQELLTERGWPFCFIGGIALQHWGEPRATRTLDWGAIQSRLAPLAVVKNEPEILAEVRALRGGAGGSDGPGSTRAPSPLAGRRRTKPAKR